MRLAVLCFVAGAWSLQQQAVLPELGWPVAAAAAGLAVALVHPQAGAWRVLRTGAVPFEAVATVLNRPPSTPSGEPPP